MDLIDIGVNLAHDSFDNDRDEVITRAREAGVARMVITGSTVESSRQAARLAASSDGTLFATAGVHPHHAGEFADSDYQALAELAELSPVVAVGECGLDYFRNFSDPADQRRVFATQLALGVETGSPVFLHQRDAHADFCSIVGEHVDALSRGVAHCFTGGRDQLEAYLDLGLYIGVTGWICDERRGHDLREAAAHIPLDRVMVETDAPYLLPRDLKPKPRTRRNEPVHLPHVLNALAACMGRTAAEVAEHTTANAERFFALPAAD